MGSSSLGCGDPTGVPFPCSEGSCALTADVPQVETRHHLRGDRGDKEQSWPSTCHTVFLLPEAQNPKCSSQTSSSRDSITPGAGCGSLFHGHLLLQTVPKVASASWGQMGKSTGCLWLFSGRDVAVSAFYSDFVSSSLPRFPNYIYPACCSVAVPEFNFIPGEAHHEQLFKGTNRI